MQHVAMNRILIGNPGTGKMTVAGIYARILKELGLLSNGTVEMCTASNLIDNVVGGQSDKNLPASGALQRTGAGDRQGVRPG